MSGISEPSRGSSLTSPVKTVVLVEPVNDLFAGQTLGNGELVSNHAVGKELILDVVHAHARLEGVFAAFQGAAIAVEHGENVEPHRAVDNALALELIGDAGRRRPRARS